MKKIVLGLSIAAASLLASDNFIYDGVPGLKIGTLGVGADYTLKYHEKLDLRLGVNYYSYNDSGTKSGINYDIDLDLQTVAVIADYYPYSSGFRLSAGLMLNNNEINYKGKATSGNFTVNDVTYAAADIGSLDGKVDFKRIAPYAGIGYNSRIAATDWSFTAELGAMFQGNPETSLNVECGSALNATQCDDLKDNVLAEKAQLDNELDGFKIYPVLSVGFAYKF